MIRNIGLHTPAHLCAGSLVSYDSHVWISQASIRRHDLVTGTQSSTSAFRQPKPTLLAKESTLPVNLRHPASCSYTGRDVDRAALSSKTISGAPADGFGP